MSVMTGRVKFFDNAKGWGFINSHDEPELDVFVHYRSIQSEGYKTLSEGQEVEFVRIKTDKGWGAAEVNVVEANGNA